MGCPPSKFRARKICKLIIISYYLSIYLTFFLKNFSKKEIVAQEIISKFEDQIKSLNPKDSKSSISNGYEFAEGKQEEYVQENVEKKPVCEYCGEETHGEGEPCPHNFNEDDQTHDYEEDL